MITVYYTRIPDNLERAREDHWLAALPPVKRDVIARMRFAKGRAASLLGLQLLKRGMQASGFEEFDLGGVCFPRKGKPYCDLPIDFNISHSKDMVVCALSADARVGVDTEWIRELSIESFQRLLNPRERAWVGKNKRRFFEIWTQKEAVVKGHGEGGIVNLKRVRIERREGIIDSRIWRLHELAIDPGYVTHMATEGNEAKRAIDVKYLAIAE